MLYCTWGDRYQAACVLTKRRGMSALDELAATNKTPSQALPRGPHPNQTVDASIPIACLMVMVAWWASPMR